MKNTVYLHGIRQRQIHMSYCYVILDPTREEGGCGDPGLAWLQVVCGCEARWMYCQILEKMLESTY